MCVFDYLALKIVKTNDSVNKVNTINTRKQ